MATEMMERVGSLTFSTQASSGTTLQCVGWWVLHSPSLKLCVTIILYFQDGRFAWAVKRIGLAGQSVPFSTHLPFNTILSSPLFSLSIVPPSVSLPTTSQTSPPWEPGLDLESLFYFKSPFHGVRFSEGHNRHIRSHRNSPRPRV